VDGKLQMEEKMKKKITMGEKLRNKVAQWMRY
jgi:hypothetical protein